MNKKKLVITIGLSLFTIFLGVAIGSSYVPIKDILLILGDHLFGFDFFEGEAKINSIVWVIRFPRVILTFLVGASLAVSGAVVQSILKNPLASPYTLGVSSGASLGAAIILLFNVTIPFTGMFTLTTFGFISGFITILFVLAFAKKVDHRMSNQTIILAGMVFSLFVNAILSILMVFARENLQRIILFQMGSFSLRGWSHVFAITPFFIIGLIGVFFYIKELDLFSYGEDEALSLGVDVPKVKYRLILFSSILTGSAVAISGVIGFIGLVTPHVVRKIIGAKHNVLIPYCVLFGGIFMTIADLIARTILPSSELPVGALTALLGAPFFAFVFFSNRR